MTQHELNRAIARATGESISEISRRGFVPLSQERLDDDFSVPAGDGNDIPVRPHGERTFQRGRAS